MKFSAVFISAVLLLGVFGKVFADDDAQTWLDRMGAAMSQMNYQGTFIYVAEDRMETMRITHVTDEHGERERLASVSGPHREIVRDQSGVKWISGDAEASMADPLVNWPKFLDQSVRGLSAHSDSYRFKLRDQKRIAERTAQRLDIIAKDGFRYGYSLWLESDTGLLLQWQLNDQHGEVLAKLLFTDLKLGSEVDTGELTDGPAQPRQVASGLPVGTSRPVSESGQWQAQWLPPGFRMTANRTPGEGQDSAFQHQLFSDGIASVSLYVEPFDPSSGSGLGLQELGTSHIFSRNTDNVLITVVGDVPAITVEKIAESVRRKLP
jgi:sigma-E factor negative regulatory protein RseB